MTKYRAVRTTVDGIAFASRAEARRYKELRLLERAGEISRLELQPVFPVTINGALICKYVADFVYFADGARVVEDVKGMVTPVYRLKKKLVEALYPGVKIVEVRRS